MKNNVTPMVSAAKSLQNQKLQSRINGVYQKFLAGEISISEYSDLVDDVIQFYTAKNFTKSWT